MSQTQAIQFQKFLEYCQGFTVVQGDTKKRELLKNPTKIEEIKKKKIDRN